MTEKHIRRSDGPGELVGNPGSTCLPSTLGDEMLSLESRCPARWWPRACLLTRVRGYGIFAVTVLSWPRERERTTDHVGFGFCTVLATGGESGALQNPESLRPATLRLCLKHYLISPINDHAEDHVQRLADLASLSGSIHHCYGLICARKG